jgi:hypothetical protein
VHQTRSSTQVTVQRKFIAAEFEVTSIQKCCLARGLYLTNSRHIGGNNFAACDTDTCLSRSSDVFQCLVTLVYIMRDKEFVNAINSSSHLL